MELSLYFPLLMLALVGLSQGGPADGAVGWRPPSCWLSCVSTTGADSGDDQQIRSFEKLKKISDELEGFNKILFGSIKPLEQHTAALHVLADEIDKVHKHFTDDMIINSGVVVGGDLITVGGVAWEYFKKGSPAISIMGLGLSLLGRCMQESTGSKEQAHNHKITDLADKIFKACEQTLQEVSGVYQEMQWRLRYLEEEEKEKAGTILHRKITEIQEAFSHLEPPKIKHQFINNNNGLFNFIVNMGLKSGRIRGSLEKVIPGLVEPASEAVSKKGVSAVQQVRKVSKYVYIFQAVGAAVNLYTDGKEMYERITHRNEGTRSELAESIRTMATHLEAVTHSLDSVLSKGKKGYKS